MNSRLRELFKLSERRSKLSMFSLELCKLVMNHKFTVVDFDKSEKIQKLISQNLKNSQKKCLTFFSTPFHSKELLETVLSCINQVNKDCVYIGIGLSEQCGYARLDSIMDFNTQFNYLDESTGIINFYSCDIENELIIDFYDEDEVWYYDLEIRGDNWTSSIENITSN